MALEEYRKKRQFQKTPEPPGLSSGPSAAASPIFVIQKHDATRLHYDLRLEIDGVLVSWAVPKGPSLNPTDKRLAVQTEDHPMEYGGFEGVIPEGYGAGTVMVWDRGTYEVEGRVASEQLARGEIKFRLHGQKLRGSFVLVKTGHRSPDPKRAKEWLLIKHRDEYADPVWDIDRFDFSALTGRNLRQIEAGLPESAQKPDELSGARKAPLPKSIEPMLAVLGDKPFSDPAWVFEIKWDGMRILARISEGQCELRSRRGLDVTSQFPDLLQLPSHIAATEAVLDGEAVVLDEEGRPEFGLMQQRMHVAQPPSSLIEQVPVIYYLFDILYCDGYDLRRVSLIERKDFLKRLLASHHPFRYSDHLPERGEDLYNLAKERGLEGIIAKRAHSSYASGRSPNWVKLKTIAELDAVVGGYTAPRGAREHFGAILLGLYEEGGQLRYIGSCGSGFNQKEQTRVWEKLQQIRTEKWPFVSKPATREQAFWVAPELVARVKFSEWTRDGHLRAPVYLGLRDDIEPKDCRIDTEQQEQPRTEPESVQSPPSTAAPDAERLRVEAELCRGKTEILHTEIGGHPVRFTNLNKIYFPNNNHSSYRKRDLLCHYTRVADFILPFLRNRPMVLRRMPGGIQGQMFYQQDAHDMEPEWMPTYPIYSEEAKKTINFFLCNDLAALLFLVNLGCIDQNPWSSQIDDLEHPDWAFFDLDPTEDTDYSVVVEAAREVARLLTDIGLTPFMKTSGAAGFHIFVPLERIYTFEQVRAFTEIVVRVIHSRQPGITTLERIVARRPPQRVYLDYLQLSYGRSLASVYSVRPVAQACVSAPVLMKELKRDLVPERFTIKTMPARLKELGDLWGNFWESRQRLEPALERLNSTVHP